MTRALALHATKNSGRPDASGAFVPEAVAFARFHACYREGFDNHLPEDARREQVRGILSRYHDLECIAIFGHGLRHSLQTGHDMQTVNELARAIANASGPRVVVVLYACSTAAKITIQRGGFADALRDALTALGKTGHVDAHTIAAHTTWNPYLQRFDMGESDSELVGDWLVAPPSKVRGKRVPADPKWGAWRVALRHTPMRFRFPTMTAGEIRKELR